MTLLPYLNYFKDAFLFDEVRRFDLKLRREIGGGNDSISPIWGYETRGLILLLTIMSLCWKMAFISNSGITAIPSTAGSLIFTGKRITTRPSGRLEKWISMPSKAILSWKFRYAITSKLLRLGRGSSGRLGFCMIKRRRSSSLVTTRGNAVLKKVIGLSEPGLFSLTIYRNENLGFAVFSFPDGFLRRNSP